MNVIIHTPFKPMPSTLIVLAFEEILENEIDFIKYISELINELKNTNDFSLQNLFYSIKSYSYITEGSIRAFFDKNGILACACLEQVASLSGNKKKEL